MRRFSWLVLGLVVVLATASPSAATVATTKSGCVPGRATATRSGFLTLAGWVVLALLALASPGSAAGGPHRLVVVVNDASSAYAI